jgi:hypothetical protein
MARWGGRRCDMARALRAGHWSEDSPNRATRSHGGFPVCFNRQKWGRTRSYYPIWGISLPKSKKNKQTMCLKIGKTRVAQCCFQLCQ